MELLIRGGTVVDPAAGRTFQSDILVKDGRVAALEKKITARGARVLDAAGKLVVPGLIDMHVHLREPGQEHKETVASGTLAAVHGGFTAVAAMPNTDPVADTPGVIRYVLEKAREAGRARVYPVGALTVGSRGRELTEMGALRAAGAVAFSDDGRPVADAHVMRRALEYARMLGVPVISHCEEPALAVGVMHEGLVSTRLGLKGTPAAAEDVAVARDLILAEMTGCHLHVAHVTTAGAVRLIREAKARGVRVTAETTPHHFTLTDRAVVGFNTNAKVNPPLRTDADVAAVREGLADGTIDVIATDHAPHAAHEKEVEFDLAPFGLVGLETAVGLVFTELVAGGVLDLVAAVAKLSTNPARVLGLSAGVIEPGAVADLTVIDPAAAWTVDRGELVGKSKNTPFHGYRLKGLPHATIIGGEVHLVARGPTES
ncbi:dihydroorotase [Candidatus Desulforudis audaxviator]|uniref:Dihydroorotase n=1 Tax=Desulforudis audaxviator (strain MP104C) TaxID=477974 RepID=B1I4N0_DESAP|nr:dihydroorotase [Candidatus Desulforudis audaxviator]ACA59815.1 dihydroorotase, multifunctional complex type [Candidatus Desulforudis audaxviator MP104C]AZK59818.1 Dihydroorotase [Candidatus Desulforudis audaxviator]